MVIIQPSIAVLTDTRLQQTRIQGYSVVANDTHDPCGSVIIAVRQGIHWKKMPAPFSVQDRMNPQQLLEDFELPTVSEFIKKRQVKFFDPIKI